MFPVQREDLAIEQVVAEFTENYTECLANISRSAEELSLRRIPATFAHVLDTGDWLNGANEDTACLAHFDAQRC